MVLVMLFSVRLVIGPWTLCPEYAVTIVKHGSILTSTDSRSLLDNSAIDYTCMGCTYLTSCENLNESLNIEGRNYQEADPEPLDDETHKKEGYEPSFTDTPTGPSIQSNKQVVLANNNFQNYRNQIPITADLNTPRSSVHTVPNVNPSAHPMQANSCETVAQNRPDYVLGQCVDSDKAGWTTNGGKNRSESNHKTNANKVQKKLGKQKLKETEQEEQLKTARSVINS